MSALDPMVRGPGASARVILVLNQKQNGSDMFWDAQAVKSISNLRLCFETRLTTFIIQNRNDQIVWAGELWA